MLTTAPLKQMTAPGRQRILIFIGDCSPCIELKLLRWERLQQQAPHLGVYFVATNTEKEIQASRKKMILTLPILADPQAKLARTYNAIFAPRAYGISSDGRLAWIQTNPEADPMEAAARFLSQ